MSERFTPRQDARPNDVVWPTAVWPVPADTVLQGRTVELRTARDSDAVQLFAALDQDVTWAHVPGRPADVEGMKALVNWKRAQPSWHPWTVRRISDGAVVGTTSYLDTSANDARTEIGSTQYTPATWGSAVNPECKLLLLEYAFETLNMGRVQLKTDIRNERSQQAIARLGAQFEGVLRRYQRRDDGSVRDTVMFSIAAEDWPTVRQGLHARLGY